MCGLLPLDWYDQLLPFKNQFALKGGLIWYVKIGIEALGDISSVQRSATLYN